jgi:hypothetical protein
MGAIAEEILILTRTFGQRLDLLIVIAGASRGALRREPPPRSSIRATNKHSSLGLIPDSRAAVPWSASRVGDADPPTPAVLVRDRRGGSSFER